MSTLAEVEGMGSYVSEQFFYSTIDIWCLVQFKYSFYIQNPDSIQLLELKLRALTQHRIYVGTVPCGAAR